MPIDIHLNVDAILWLEKGVYLDETSGHIDNFCRFVAPGEVVLTWTDDRNDPQYEISAAALKRLQEAKDARGRSIKVHKLHMPNPILITEEEAAGVDKVAGTLPREPGNRLAASYVNFYVGNSVVVMPKFDDPHDAPAQALMAKVFPGRRVVAVPGREILLAAATFIASPSKSPRVRRCPDLALDREGNSNIKEQHERYPTRAAGLAEAANQDGCESPQAALLARPLRVHELAGHSLPDRACWFSDRRPPCWRCGRDRYRDGQRLRDQQCAGELRRGERAHRVIVVPLRVELPVWPEGTKQLGHFDVVDDG